MQTSSSTEKVEKGVNMHEIKKQLKKDIKEFEEGKRPLNGSTLDTLHKLTDTYKNICKIELLESEESGYSEGSSYAGEGSYARGRRNAPRDRMGRFTSYGMDRYAEEGYSEDGGSYRGSYRGESYGGGKDHLKMKLGEMMEDADPKERETLKKLMREIDHI
jgi:hypothetical protein